MKVFADLKIESNAITEYYNIKKEDVDTILKNLNIKEKDILWEIIEKDGHNIFKLINTKNKNYYGFVIDKKTGLGITPVMGGPLFTYKDI